MTPAAGASILAAVEGGSRDTPRRRPQLGAVHRQGEETGDFFSWCLDGGTRWLHLHPSRRYKSTTVDLFLPCLLRPGRSTALALLARLLGRGTRHYPSLRQLSRYTDWLYGSELFVATERVGPFQVLHLHFGAVDGRFLPRDEDLLQQGCRLLADVLLHPHAPQGLFPRRWVAQEREGLRQALAAGACDRTARAQRRCLQIMCPDEPYRISAEGDIDEIDRFGPRQLRRALEHHVRTAPAHIYICGDVDPARALTLCESFDWHRARRVDAPTAPAPSGEDGGRHVVETADVSQGRLMIGHRARVRLGEGDYPALVLLNLLLGGDTCGRLYRRLREGAGLCYHIASCIEPMAGFLFVEAGIEAARLDLVQAAIASEIDALGARGPAVEELATAKRLCLHRLEGIADHRDALVHFDIQRRLAGAEVSRRRLGADLAEVSVEDVRRVAAGIHRDTCFFLAPPSTAAPGGTA